MTNAISARILQSVTKPAEAPKPTPAAKEIEWTQLDPDSLSPDLRKAYDAYRQAAKAAAVLRTEFEARMTVAIAPLDLHVTPVDEHGFSSIEHGDPEERSRSSGSCVSAAPSGLPRPAERLRR